MRSVDPKVIINERLAFTEEFGIEFAQEVKLLQQVHDLAGAMLGKFQFDGEGRDHFKAILYYAVVRLINLVESMIVLAGLGHSPDAGIMFRSIFDLCLSLAYIEKDIPIRSLLFARYESFARYDIIKKRVEMFPEEEGLYLTEIQDAEYKLEVLDKEILKLDPNFRIPNGTRWSGKSIADMAKEVGLDPSYRMTYPELSTIVHSSAGSTAMFMTIDLEKGLKPHFYPNKGITQKVIQTATVFALFILDIVNKNLAFGLDERVNELQDIIKAGLSGD